MKPQNKKQRIATSAVIAALTITWISPVQAEEAKNSTASTGQSTNTSPATNSGKPNQTKTKKSVPLAAQKNKNLIDLTSKISTLILLSTNPAPIIITAPLYYIWKTVSH